MQGFLCIPSVCRYACSEKCRATSGGIVSAERGTAFSLSFSSDQISAGTVSCGFDQISVMRLILVGASQAFPLARSSRRLPGRRGPEGLCFGFSRLHGDVPPCRVCPYRYLLSCC